MGGPKKVSTFFFNNFFCRPDRTPILFAAESVRAGQPFSTLIHSFSVMIIELLKKTTFELRTTPF